MIHTPRMAPHDLRLLTEYVEASNAIYEAWDKWTLHATDPDGWPLDAREYGARAHRRDAETLAAYKTFAPAAPRLLAVAAQQLSPLHPKDVPPSTAWQFEALRTAFIALTCLGQEWQRTRANLPPDAGPGTAAYDDALDAYQSECWSYLDDWRGYGHVLSRLDEATARAAPAPPMPAARSHRGPTNGPTRT